MVVPHTNRYYLAVAIGLVTLVALAYGGAFWLMHRPPLNGTAIPSAAVIGTPGAQTIPPNVTVIPIPTIDPQPFPTPIFDGSTSGAQTQVPWTVTKQVDPQFHRTYWMAPDDVVAQVRQDYQAIDAYRSIHLFDTTPAQIKQFYSQPELDIVLRDEQDEEQRNEVSGVPTLIRPELQVLGFSADGGQVQIAQELHGETFPVYNRTTHQLIRVEHLPVGVAVSTLTYDRQDKRWKVSDSVFVPGPPGIK